jgi:alkanesulfonate monooxygenase SsuD/methylene tetrahydromethanopterin reductase-like flavin-dependent oxidoreductase (luciferase family)
VEHEWFGSDTTQTRDAYDEVLGVVLQALSTGRINHHGKRFHYDDVPVRFDMVQQPYPRFWYAGNLQRAAEQGMNALGRTTREMVEQYWQIWQAGRARRDPRFLGEDPLVGSTRHIVVADTDAEAVSLARRAFHAYADHFHATAVRIEGGVPHYGALPRPGGINVDAMLEAGHVLAGSAATVRDRLRRFVDAIGPQHNYLCAAFQWGDLTTEEARHSLDLFATEVKPALT